MTTQQEPIYIPIRVTAGVILRIGAGIYHSVAGALKELVSNSYDADATAVVITTNYPDFDEIKVVDNGSGMTEKRFGVAMQNIGSSLKGIIDQTRLSPKYKRPIIGHLGIGFMALTQICSEVSVESQLEGSDTKFVADIDFSIFDQKEQQHIHLSILEILEEQYGNIENAKKRLNDPKLDLDEKKKIEWYLELIAPVLEKQLDENPEKPTDEHLGYCLIYDNIPAVLGDHGTTITLRKIKPSVIGLLSDLERAPDGLPKNLQEKNASWADYRDELNVLDWKEICERLRRGTLPFTSLPQYHQFLYELSLLTPVQYYPNSPLEIENNILKNKREQLNQFDFVLQVDNRRLYKPILLPSGNLIKQKLSELEKGFDYYFEEILFEKIIDNELLKFSGYIYWQREQNQPSTQRGIHIFIRNSGVGGYDQTLLNFSVVNPTSRAGQVSGEIYVEEGLERALNVDRHSFKETDAHYIALQKHIWKILGSGALKDGVFGKSVEAYYKRKERSDTLVQEKHEQVLIETVRLISSSTLGIEFKNGENKEPYEIQGNKFIIFNDCPKWPRSISERQSSQRILVSAKAALLSGANTEELYNLLEELLLGK